MIFSKKLSKKQFAAVQQAALALQQGERVVSEAKNVINAVLAGFDEAESMIGFTLDDRALTLNIECPDKTTVTKARRK
jgi:hypothetical protein